MFTGIIQGIGRIHDINYQNNILNLEIEFPENLCNNLIIGASVAVNGICLTVTKINNRIISFDVIQQTLEITEFGFSEKFDYLTNKKVNLERSIKYGDEIGGHKVSGHVDFTTKIIFNKLINNKNVLRVNIPKEFINYFFIRGFIAIHGISLTISNINYDEYWLEVSLIPETIKSTVLSNLNYVNIEIDKDTQIIVDTIRNSFISKLNCLK